MKKIILLFALNFILSNSGFSQNILYLKNGDKMNGKLEGYKNDTIIFNLQGNKLKFKTSFILSIYFDEKLAPQDLSKESAKSEIKSPQEGKIFGVVTYYFNKNFGDKPDVGAEVYLADSLKTINFNFASIDSFYFGNIYRNLYLSYQSRGKVPGDIIEEVKKYKVDSEEAYNSLDRRASENIFHLKYGKGVMKTVIDGSGNYSFKVKPGTYYVCITSNNRKGLNTTEVLGKIFCQKVIVKEGEDINISHNFRL